MKWAVVALLLVLTSVVPTPSAAQGFAIGPGREAEVLALFAPHALGDELVEGCRLDGVQIEPRQIVVRLAGPSEPVVVRLQPRSSRSDVPRSASFSFRGDGLDHPAALALMRAVRANDDGTFWEGESLVEVLPDVLDGTARGEGSFDLAGYIGRNRIVRDSPWPSLLSAGAALVLIALSFVRRRRPS